LDSKPLGKLFSLALMHEVENGIVTPPKIYGSGKNKFAHHSRGGNKKGNTINNKNSMAKL
jgi:hypothetical protein